MEYRNLKLDERHLARDLFASYYDDNVYCNDPRYFDWLHLDHPLRTQFVDDDEYTVLAAIDDDRLLGCIQYVPGEVYLEGRVHSAVFTTESLARADAGGVYGLLARRLNGRFDYCFTMGAIPFLRDLYVNQLGADYCHHMNRVVLVGNDDALRRILARHPNPPSIDPDRLRSWAEAARRLAAGRPWQPIETAEEIRDLYWRDLTASGVPCTRKDPSWLAWRYLHHPHLHYDMISSGASQHAGIAVIRRESIADPGCEALRLLEFLPTADGSTELAGAVARYAVETGCAFLDFFCAHDDWISRLPPAFVRPEEHHHAIPYLTQPLEWRERRSINLLSTRNRRRRRALAELGGGRIYITKGDGAQDVALDRGYRSAHLRENTTRSGQENDELTK